MTHDNLCIKYISRLKLVYICYVLRQINRERQPHNRIIREGFLLVYSRCERGLGVFGVWVL
jgi:hypothetical protein